MPTLTETVIDIADRHTTLYYLGAKPPAGPLPFHAEKAYCDLHEALGEGAEYTAATKGRTPTLLGRLAPGYSENKYWLRYLGMAPSDFRREAWQHCLPIDASLGKRIVHLTDARSSFRVSPVPRVRLYPFGWSTWISLRLLGAHTISDLVAFLERLLADRVLKYEDGESTLSLSELFADVATAVRKDAFGGNDTHDVYSQDIGVVTTVMAKHGGSLSVGALGPDEQTELRRITRPYGPPPGGPFAQQVYALPPGDGNLEYLVHDKHGRFLWVEHLLEQNKQKHVQLRCYHNNSFISLIHAWHLKALLDAVMRQPHPARATVGLAQAAVALLEAPGYKCASLMQYLDEPDVAASVKDFAAFCHAAGP